MPDSHGKLAYAILVWDFRHREGTRSQQIDAERELTLLAKDLRALGYELKAKR